MTEAEILERYSTIGLRKNEFNRAAKKDWLSYAYPNMDRAERDKILDQLFGQDVVLFVPEDL